jgi:hypothetical protein
VLHVDITTQVDINYAVMHIAGYLAAPTEVMFEGLEHTMRCLSLFFHMPIMYHYLLINKKSLVLHWGKGTAEFIPPKYGTVLVSTTNADYDHDICDRCYLTSHMHLLNGVIVTCKCKKQAIATLHSTGSAITSLTSVGKKTNHMRDFMSSLGCPVAGTAPTLEDSQCSFRVIKASRIHDNTRHLATKMPWLNEQYVAGIIKFMYTKTTLQLADVNTKSLCGKHLQSMLSFLIGVRF